jgi:membrane protein insertase Oxa1/YidC/SpoIIIJ
LQESIFFRLDRFLWMPSLSAPDMLLGWGNWIPGINRPEDLGSLIYLGPFLNLLPILTIGLFIVQQKIMMPPPTDEQQEMQQNMMKYMMIFIGIMFYKVAAGLCIYFIASTLWGLAERQFLPKKKEGAEPPRDEDRRDGDGRKRPKPGPNGDGWRQKLSNWWEDVLKEAGKQNQARRAEGKKPRD